MLGTPIKPSVLDVEFGSTISVNKEWTTFSVWSPLAENVWVSLYEESDSSSPSCHLMIRDPEGVWSWTAPSNLHGHYYTYLVEMNGVLKECPDPYSKSSSVNGEKSMIVDFSLTNPIGWENQLQINTSITESILYELHLRDYSSHDSSGVESKGKYLSLTELGTHSPDGLSTGLSHLLDLGVTHVHLLPVFDFTSVDERAEGYNWGYDPYLYNVLEGSYSSNPYDGITKVREFKSMVQELHNNGLGVVLDVVYNHTSHEKESPFDILAPQYYYRMTEEGYYSNGSGCGNELATEKPIVRKFIIDSLKFWLTEYNVDGFRFDLMALYDEDTMKMIEAELRKIKPNIILYGEPWIGGLSILPEDKRFNKGKQWGTHIGMFNDEVRNAIKGDSDGESIGFVMGLHGLETKIMAAISGGVQYDDWLKGFSQDPSQTVNYVSCHDNLTLYDKIEKTARWASAEDRRRMNRLALSLVLTSFGVPFLHAGSEFLRSKRGHHNSYNSGDSINQIDWGWKKKNHDIFFYIQSLIRFRKDQKVFQTSNANIVRDALEFIPSLPGVIAYKTTSPFEEDYREILIIHNANNYGVRIPFLEGEEWLYVANGDNIDLDIRHSVSEKITVLPISTCILVKE